MKDVQDSSINSLSSLHAVEHFGLGRYGDPVSPGAYLEAINEMQRIVQKNGNIYFSVPIGIQRLEFNAHRIFDPQYIIDLFNKCDLIEFSAIDDDNEFIINSKPQNYIASNYSCGLYHFRKK